MTRTIAMVPARMGSQRLPQKNLRELSGVSLIARAIRKCHAAGCFDAVYVNSEDAIFGQIADREGAQFYQRPEELGSNSATSEEFLTDFFEAVEDVDYLVQVHSIAPLLTAREVFDFTVAWKASGHDVMLSCIEDQIEVAFNGTPVNFTFTKKTNSQELIPTQRITWSVSGWRRMQFLAARAAGQTATYAGSVGFHPVSAISGHVIKTETDLKIAEALLSVLPPEVSA